MRKENTWISVLKQLPPIGVIVEVKLSDGDIYIDRRAENGIFAFNDISGGRVRVTHWRLEN